MKSLALFIVVVLVISFVFVSFANSSTFSPFNSAVSCPSGVPCSPPNRNVLLDESEGVAYDSLDPGVGFFTSDGYFANVFQSLVAYNPSNSTLVEPDLASNWTVGPGPLYTSGPASVGSWSSTASYPIDSWFQSCPTYAGYMYCVGGSDSGTNATYYAPLTSTGVGTWVSTTDYPAIIDLQSCVIIAGYIYCVGGYSNTLGWTNATYYAPVSSAGIGTWTATADYPLNISYQSCVPYSAFVYCIGGAVDGGGGGITSSVYYSEVNSSGVMPNATWTSTTSYPLQMSTGSCVTSSDIVYCVGGSGPSANEYYNEVYYAQLSSSGVGSWSSTTNYPIEMERGSCASSSSDIYCVGGFGSGGRFNATYYTTISSAGIGTWTSTTTYPTSIENEACGVYTFDLYCVAGQNTTGALTSNVYYAPLIPSSYDTQWNFTMRPNTWFSNNDPINSYVAWFSFVRELYMNAPSCVGSCNYAGITLNMSNPLDNTPNGNIFPDGLQSALANVGWCTADPISDNSCVTALNNMLSNFNPANATQDSVMSYPDQAYVAVNSSLFQINTIQPYPLTLQVLPSQWGAIVDPVYIDANGGVQNNTQPSSLSANGMPGSGPYMYGDHTAQNTQLILNKNTNYWGNGVSGLPANLQPANITTIEIEYGNLQEISINDFAANDAQIISPAVGNISSFWSAYTANYPNANFSQVFQPKGYPLCDLVNDLNTQYSGSFGYAPVGYENVRQALVHAVNYTEILDQLYTTTNPSNGSVLTLAQLFLPPVPPGWGNLDNPDNIPLYSYNITLATQLIAAAGNADGFYVTLQNGTSVGDLSGQIFKTIDYGSTYPLGPSQLTAIDIMNSSFNQIGISVGLVGYQITNGSPSSTPPIMPGGWCADWPDPIYQLFYDLATPVGDQANWVNNATLNTLLGEIPFEPNATLQLEQTVQAYNIFTQLSSILQLPNPETYFMVQPYVQNVVYSPFQFAIYYNMLYYSTPNSTTSTSTATTATVTSTETTTTTQSITSTVTSTQSFTSTVTSPTTIFSNVTSATTVTSPTTIFSTVTSTSPTTILSTVTSATTATSTQSYTSTVTSPTTVLSTITSTSPTIILSTVTSATTVTSTVALPTTVTSNTTATVTSTVVSPTTQTVTTSISPVSGSLLVYDYSTGGSAVASNPVTVSNSSFTTTLNTNSSGVAIFSGLVPLSTYTVNTTIDGIPLSTPVTIPNSGIGTVVFEPNALTTLATSLSITQSFTVTGSTGTIPLVISTNNPTLVVTSLNVTSGPVTTVSGTVSQGYTLSFDVSGQSQSNALVNVTILKSEVPSGFSPVVSIDGQVAANQSFTQNSTAYFVSFAVPHFSTHTVTIRFSPSTTTSSSSSRSAILYEYVTIGTVVIAVIACGLLLVLRRKKVQQ